MFSKQCSDPQKRSIENTTNSFELIHEYKKDAKLATTGNPLIKISDDSYNICKELRECKLNEVLTQKRRQQLRANSQELRQLERQLQLALVSKQLKEQQQNIAHRKEQELRIKREENERFIDECALYRKTIQLQAEQEEQKKAVLLSTLKCQMNDLQQKRRIEFEKTIEDYDEIQNLVKKIEAEKLEERKEAQEVRDRFKKEIEESLRIKKLKEQVEKERDVDDAASNLAYQTEYDNLKSQRVAKMKFIQKQKEALSERIGQQLATLKQEKEKRENLLVSLLVEERKAKDNLHFREALVKQIKERKKDEIDMEYYRQEIKIRKEEFKREEEKFRQENLRYLEERDKINQLSDEKRRRKKMEHSKALKEMIEIRRCEKAKIIATQITDFENQINQERKSNQLVEEERRRMLNAVPNELLSYLPPGVLRSSDKEFLTLNADKT